MVAKSYQELEQVGDVFISTGKQYVNVRLKSGKIKSVRWYTDKEYAKMYPEEKKTAVAASPDLSNDPYYKPQKEVLGFTKGYITIFKGELSEEADEWMRWNIKRYARWWGWYVLSTDEVPADLPFGVEPVRLPWALVGNDDGKLKPEEQVKEAVETFLYSDNFTSVHVGKIGERLELFLTVEKNIKIENNYGSATLHIFRDQEGNAYTWLTSAKSWLVGAEKHIRGTIKDHKKYKGECTTELTRCMEVK